MFNGKTFNILKNIKNLLKVTFFSSDDRFALILISIIVGILSGIASLILSFGLHNASKFLLFLYENYKYLIIIFPAIGALCSSLFLIYIVKEKSGHGVPEVISSVLSEGGALNKSMCLSRIIASLLTIGSGGSAGPEAPASVSGAAIGSNIGKLLKLNERQKITLIGCGSAGAIAAIFNAPITGIIFSLEVILGEWSKKSIIPIAISAVVGAETLRIFTGANIPFSYQDVELNLWIILFSVFLGIFCAFISICLTFCISKIHNKSHKLIKFRPFSAMLGGLMVGLIAFFISQEALGEGYHWTSLVISGKYQSGIWIVFIVVLAKVITTSLTLGSGGSGGIFAPSLTLGAFAGLLFYRIIQTYFPQISLGNESLFALLGMSGIISGILQAPLTGIFLIVEITGSYNAILPLIVVSVFSTTIAFQWNKASFYMKDIIKENKLLRLGTDARILSDLKIKELLETDLIVVSDNMNLEQFVNIVKKSSRNYYPVLDPQTKQFLGMVNFEDIKRHLFGDSTFHKFTYVGNIMRSNYTEINPNNSLYTALKVIDKQKIFSLPIVYKGQFYGIISKATILDKYRNELMLQTQHLYL